MVKKNMINTNFFAGLTQIAFTENPDLTGEFGRFLDSLVKESQAEYAMLSSYDGAKTFLSQGISAQSIKYSDPDLLSWEISHWGVLYVKKPNFETSKKANEESFWEQVVGFLTVLMNDIELRESAKLIEFLTSEVRKTLRPDIALEKICDTLQQFLGIQEFYFFRKVDESDALIFELSYTKKTAYGQDKYELNDLNSDITLEKIKRLDYIKPNLKAEIFESKLRDKLWGFMVVAKFSQWSDQDKALVRPFAEQMATVYNQHKLRSESLSMAQREFLLNQITTTIRKSLEVDEIIEIAAQEIAQVMGVESCGIMILNRRMRGRLSHYVWSANDDFSERMTTLLQESLGTAYAPNLSNPTVNIPNFAEEKSPQGKLIYSDLELKSYLSCAVYREGSEELLGMISVASFNHHTLWSDDDEQLLESIAKQLEIALVQASLYQEAQQTKRQMALLHKLSSDIRNSLDISIVMGQIAKGLGEVLGLNRCFVRRFTRDNKVLKTEQEYTTNRFTESADIIFDFEEEWISKLTKQPSAVNTFEYLNIPYVRSKLRSGNSKLLNIAEAIQLKSYLAVPLIARGRLLGTINIHQCDRERNFLAEEIEFISRVASEGAIAIEHAELFETIDRMNKTDPDTGLYNKRYFRIVAEKEIQAVQREKKDLSLIMLDLDHLKAINDTPEIGGHDAGDEAISIVARVLEKTVRQTPIDEVRKRISDVVGRYGGDEFMILLPNTNIHDAISVAERIGQNLKKAKHSTWTKELTCSIGVAGTPTDPYSYEVLQTRADRALYLSKDKGRATVSSSLEL